MSLSAGSLASPCNSRLSRERRGALRLCFPVRTILRPLITYALLPPLASPFLSLHLPSQLSFLSRFRARVLVSTFAKLRKRKTVRRDSPKNFVVLLNYYTSLRIEYCVFCKNKKKFSGKLHQQLSTFTVCYLFEISHVFFLKNKIVLFQT